jgi:hypothetical protein
MTTAQTIQTAKTPAGASVRLQRRGQKFDVIRNTTGYCWNYVEKAVTEQQARAAFYLLCL